MRWIHVFAATLVVAGAVPAFAGDDVQVIVKFKGAIDAGLVRGKGGGSVVAELDARGAVVATLPAGKIAALRADPSVSYVEEDGICEALRPGKGGGGSQPPEQPAQTTPWGVAKVLAGGATEKGLGVKVGVIDTGIDLTHPDLAANVKGNALFVSSGKATDGDDDNGHGSHVAGTIAAIDNTIGVVGVAPQASLYAAKVLNKRGSGTWSSVAAGIDWCRSIGVNIGNMSLGGSGSNSTLQAACDQAAAAGMLLIAAAGNEGDGNTATSEISYPAYYASVVSVGATTSSDTLASFSNTNSDVEVSGPGYQVPSTTKDGGYATFSGTSMATPHAVGVAALLWGAAASPTAATVRASLTGTALDLGPSGRDTGFGYGRVRYSD